MSRLFDGVNDFLFVNSTPITAAPFTMSVWFRDNDATEDAIMFWLGDKDGASENWNLRVRGDQAGNPVDFRSKSFRARTTSGFTINTWHHACGIEASSTDRRVFIDGGSKGTGTDSSTPVGADRVGIGADTNGTPSLEFSGDLAHGAIWNVALTDAEVASLGAKVSPLRIRRDALVFYCPVGGQDPELDIIGARNMSLNDTPAKSEEPPIPYSVVAPG